MLALVRCWCWCWSWCGVGVVDVDIFVGGGVVGGVGVDSGGTVGGNGVVAADVVGVWGLHPSGRSVVPQQYIATPPGRGFAVNDQSTKASEHCVPPPLPLCIFHFAAARL